MNFKARLLEILTPTLLLPPRKSTLGREGAVFLDAAEKLLRSHTILFARCIYRGKWSEKREARMLHRGCCPPFEEGFVNLNHSFI
jgi:hypothetical protein